MATIYWLGTASSTAQVSTATPGGTIEVGDKFILTLTGEDGSTQSITVSATATTVAQTVADIVSAWNASTQTLFTAVTATNSTTHVTLTADTAGVPFNLSVSTTESDDSPADAQTFSSATTTANSSTGDWNVAGNWSGGAVPTTGDNVHFRNNSVSVTYGLNQSAVTLASLNIDQTYTGNIGTSSAYLRVSATALRIGDPSRSATTATGSQRIKINLGTAQTTAVVVNTNTTSTADTGLEPVRLLGTHASNSLVVMGGRVGVGTTVPGEASTFATVSVTGSQAVLTLGSGCTLTTVNQSNGTLTVGAACTTINQTGGTLYTQGSGAVTTANVGGTAYLNSTGTVTNLNVTAQGVADFTQDARARTVTNCTLYEGATLRTDNGSPLSVTFTSGIDLSRCGLDDCTLEMGDHYTISLSAI